MSDTKTFTISNINDKPGLVVRGDDAEQLGKDIEAVMPVFRDFEKQFNKTPAGHPIVRSTPYQSKPAPDLSDDAMRDVPCNVCKGPRTLSKNGNWVCKDFCWTK